MMYTSVSLLGHHWFKSNNVVSPVRCQAIFWTNAVCCYWTLKIFKWSFNQIATNLIQENEFKDIALKAVAILSGPRCVEGTQRTHDVKITSLLRQNDVVTSFRRNNDVIFTSCVRWGSTKVTIGETHLKTLRPDKMVTILQTTFSNTFYGQLLYFD